ncbi:hypothetical protein [Clostridium tetani]|nr:hypothetical protein [Clostridium tetani]
MEKKYIIGLEKVFINKVFDFILNYNFIGQSVIVLRAFLIG